MRLITMPASDNTFSNLAELRAYIEEQKSGFIVVGHWNMPEYEGMVQFMAIRFDTEKNLYQLEIEYMCLGLDLYGDTLMEGYDYKFESIEKIAAYIFSKFGIAVTHIQRKYATNHAELPNPIYYAGQAPVYQEAWERFQEDFKSGKFLDRELELVWSSEMRE